MLGFSSKLLCYYAQNLLKMNDGTKLAPSFELFFYIITNFLHCQFFIYSNIRFLINKNWHQQSNWQSKLGILTQHFKSRFARFTLWWRACLIQDTIQMQQLCLKKKKPCHWTLTLSVRQIMHHVWIFQYQHHSHSWACHTLGICLLVKGSNRGINGPNGLKWKSFTNIVSIFNHINLEAENSTMCCMDSLQKGQNMWNGSGGFSALTSPDLKAPVRPQQ